MNTKKSKPFFQVSTLTFGLAVLLAACSPKIPAKIQQADKGGPLTDTLEQQDNRQAGIAPGEPANEIKTDSLPQVNNTANLLKPINSDSLPKAINTDGLLTPINTDDLPRPISADSLPKTVTFDSKGIKTTTTEPSAEQKKQLDEAYQGIIRNLAAVGIKVDSILEISDNGNTILAMQNNKKVTIKNVNGKYVLVN